MEGDVGAEVDTRHWLVFERTRLEAFAASKDEALHIAVKSGDPVFDWIAAFIGRRADKARASRKQAADVLGLRDWGSPYLIGLAGSVASGKSTVSAQLVNALTKNRSKENIVTVSTDNFLLPTAALKARGVLPRKGYPESYDRRRLLAFVEAVSAGERGVVCPVYDHATYDIVPGKEQTFDRPDILIVEGLNVLQTGRAAPTDRAFISDYFDLAIYLDAELTDLQTWYEDRFVGFVERSTMDHPYYGQFHGLGVGQLQQAAQERWRAVNLPNLMNNIAPTKLRADIIIHQDATHRINRVSFSKHWL